MLPNVAVQKPMGVEPFGGGRPDRSKGAFPLQNQSLLQPTGAAPPPRIIGPDMPPLLPRPNDKPGQNGPVQNDNFRGPMPLDDAPLIPPRDPVTASSASAQGGPLAASQPAKPQTMGDMPPFIRPPQAPNYQPTTPTLPGLPSPNSANVQAPSIGVGNATAGNFNVENFRPFADAVYSEATRQLDPAFEQRERQFRQQMQNQGITEGTEAFDNAFANFTRERNDAYGSARNQALAQALGAQNQMFGQSLANNQMGLQAGMANAANSLQAQGMNLGDRNSLLGLGLQAQGMGMQDRQFGANLGLQYGQLGQQAQMANAANWINQNQFGRNFEFGRERADMQDLMALLGYGQQTTSYNNALLGQDQQRAGSLFGLIPGLTPTQLDVMGAANMWNQQHMQGRQMQADARNGMYQALGQLGGAMLMSDRRLKTDIQRVGTLDNGLPVYRYRYKAGGPMQIGVMAQDVLGVNPSAVGEVGGFLAVDYAEAVK